MRVLLTGGAGFVGGAVARRLRAEGHDVVAVVRDPDRAGGLRELGADVVGGDLTSPEALVGRMRGCDAVVHAAGSYRIGIRPGDRPAMYEANVAATARVLDAAAAAAVGRTVHVSTIGVFGDTRGRIVDEDYRRDLRDGFLSYYDETKYLAHVAARERMGAGVPIVVVQPGSVYGPGDHAETGARLRAAHQGRLRYVAAGDAGLSFVHVDDVAAGIVAALVRGRAGEAYVLGGPNIRLRDALDVAARLGGRRLPRLVVPPRLFRALGRVPAPIAAAAGLPPNLAEAVAAADGVTYWASSAKASLKLGYAPRELEAGLRETFAER